MEWLVLLLGIGGIAHLGRRRWRRRSARRAELEQLRQVADEDVTLLGEELRRLDSELADRELDEATRVDYQRALDAYESAERTVRGLSRADEISKVTDTLSTGRYAMVCVRARVAGRPAPEYRVPCFFNPQHGPSTEYVLRRTELGDSRTVPACAQDAARVAAGKQPAVRYVEVHGRRVPYWEAGTAFAPYGMGYFAGSVVVANIIAVPPDTPHGATYGESGPGGAFEIGGGFEFGGDVGGDGGGG